MCCQIITFDNTHFVIFYKQPLIDTAIAKAGTRLRVVLGSEDGTAVLSHLCQEFVFWVGF